MKTLDKILKCCIFAALFDIKQDNNKSNKVTTTKNKKRNEKNRKKH